MNTPLFRASATEARLRAEMAETFPMEPVDADQVERVLAQLPAPARLLAVMPKPLAPAHRRGWTAGMLAAAVAALVALIGVSTTFLLTGAFDPSPASSPPPVQLISGQSEAASSPPPSVAEPSTAGLVSADPELYRVDDSLFEVSGMIQFRSPSGNIVCTMADQGIPGADCEIAEADYQLQGCPGDAGATDGIQFHVHNAGQAGDPAPTAADTVGQISQICGSAMIVDSPPLLPYGSTLTLGGTICTSESSGVSCRSLTSGAGFELSRASYRLF